MRLAGQWRLGGGCCLTSEYWFTSSLEADKQSLQINNLEFTRQKDGQREALAFEFDRNAFSCEMACVIQAYDFAILTKSHLGMLQGSILDHMLGNSIMRARVGKLSEQPCSIALSWFSDDASRLVRMLFKAIHLAMVLKLFMRIAMRCF